MPSSLVASTRPDIVLMDVRMPLVDGVEENSTHHPWHAAVGDQG